jgi:heme-degrading monooxygenase HmoA
LQISPNIGTLVVGIAKWDLQMFWEIAQIEVKAGEEPAFEAAVAQAVPLFRGSRGCHGMQLHRSVEFPTRYRLVVDWQTVEDHTVHFRASEQFKEWRRLVGGFFASPPVVEHTARLPLGFGKGDA